MVGLGPDDMDDDSVGEMSATSGSLRDTSGSMMAEKSASASVPGSIAIDSERDEDKESKKGPVHRTAAATRWTSWPSNWRSGERCCELPTPVVRALHCGTPRSGRCGCGPSLGSRSYVATAVFIAFAAGIADMGETAVEWSALDTTMR